jgi:transcriptional regulator with XRE-family HTH domain
MKKETYLINLGVNIRKLRKDKGFTQEAFADHAGLDRAYYGAIERGERNVATLNLIKIAQGLEVQIGEIFPTLIFSRKKNK